MTLFLSYLINGINLGSIYAIIALGYTMVYGIARMLNFAHGDVIMIGAYICFIAVSSMGLSPLLGVLLAMVVCTVLGMTIERLAYRPLRQAASLAVLIRRLRRMVRDRLYRSRSVEETLRLYDSVQRGEGLYIMPHKHRATHEIDTFFPYEIGAYRPLLLQDLLGLDPQALAPIQDLLQILTNAAPLREAFVPRSSMIREFIGNGQFAY